ncbi:MAG: hypothetical protein E6G34_05850 [Actinobacteria bacterium]|nr:MAG: hypothetical protein E6G34_05850 [Actinomycetota bacterium]
MQWSELESYRQLVDNYNSRREAYEKALTAWREAQAANTGDPQELQATKAKLDAEYADLGTLLARINAMRNELAHARDSAVTQPQ